MEDGLYVCHDKEFKGEMEYLKAKVDAGTLTSLVWPLPSLSALDRHLIISTPV